MVFGDMSGIVDLSTVTIGSDCSTLFKSGCSEM